MYTLVSYVSHSHYCNYEIREAAIPKIVYFVCALMYVHGLSICLCVQWNLSSYISGPSDEIKANIFIMAKHTHTRHRYVSESPEPGTTLTRQMMELFPNLTALYVAR